MSTDGEAEIRQNKKGGWVYAAKSAGALLPEGAVIDCEGKPTRNPEDYFNGGAILPSGGAKGYALALITSVTLFTSFVLRR